MCFLGWMYPAVWEMMSHWSSLKQRENCCSRYSFNLPPVFPTYSTLCTLAGQSCPFVFFLLHSSLFHCPTCPDHCMSFPSLSSPPAFTSLTGDILSYFLHLCFSALSPSSLPHDPCLSHPPTVQPSLSSFVFSLFSACFVCVCVYVTVFFLWLTREMFSCCWALEEAAWQNYSSVRNTQRRIHVVCPSVRRQGAVSNSGNLERFQNFKCVHEF